MPFKRLRIAFFWISNISIISCRVTSRWGWKQSMEKNDFKNAPEDFLLIEETERLPFRKCFFFCRKRESSQKENKTWKAYTNGIWTLSLSLDDPACINLCITYKYLKALTSVLAKTLSCRFWLQHRENMCKYMKWKLVHRPTNSLLTLNFF